MYRINSEGSVNGRFTDDAQNGGVGATAVAAAWLNAVQDELEGLSTIGGAALDPANGNQARAAVLAAIANVNTALLQEETFRGNAIAGEAAARVAGFAQVYESLAAEELVRGNSDAAEANARVAAITAEANVRIAAIAAEATARQADVTQIYANLAAEEAIRGNSYAAEVTAREAAINQVYLELGNEEVVRGNSVAAEANARVAGDTQRPTYSEFGVLRGNSLPLNAGIAGASTSHFFLPAPAGAPATMVQIWGYNAPTNHPDVVTFPLAFPTACTGVWACEENVLGWGTDGAVAPTPTWVGIALKDRASFWLAAAQLTGGGVIWSPGTACMLMATGY